MSNIVRTTTSKDEQIVAAKLISEIITKLGYRNAIIGGFALRLLGSERTTNDIDILVETEDATDIQDLRERLTVENHHLVQVAVHLYYTQGSSPGQLSQTGHNVLIETLPTGSLGLPKVIGPVLEFEDSESGFRFPILHPKILILTKLSRWCKLAKNKSTRPQTLMKVGSDSKDIGFLIEYLSQHQHKIAFDEYSGVQKHVLQGYVRSYWEYLIRKESMETIEHLKRILTPEDLDAIGEGIQT